MSDLHTRIARALGWTEDSVRSFSWRALRELVRGDYPALAEEIAQAEKRRATPRGNDDPEFDL